jgi:hypothetical protein
VSFTDETYWLNRYCWFSHHLPSTVRFNHVSLKLFSSLHPCKCYFLTPPIASFPDPPPLSASSCNFSVILTFLLLCFDTSHFPRFIHLKLLCFSRLGLIYLYYNIFQLTLSAWFEESLQTKFSTLQRQVKNIFVKFKCKQ